MKSANEFYILSPESVSNPSSGVENVINILESSLRSSPDSGIGEDSTKESIAPDEKADNPNEMMTSEITSDSQTDKQSGGSLKENSPNTETNDSLNRGHEIETNSLFEEVSIEKNPGATENDETDKALLNNDDSQENEHMISNGREGQKDSNFWKSLHNLQEIDTIHANIPESGTMENCKDTPEDSEIGLDIREDAAEEESLPEENKAETERNDDSKESANNINPEEVNTTESNIALDENTISDENIQKTEPLMRVTPQPMTRVETLKKQESEDVTVFSLQSLKPQCDTEAEDKEDPEEDEELRKLSWDSDTDERADLGLEDGTTMKVQVGKVLTIL